MKVTSVNIGRPERIAGYKRKTGIVKRPAQEAVEIGPLGLAGDAVLDTKNHGGPDQAVYIYGQPDYDWWAKELGHDLPPGLFGENLTIAGLESQKMLIGDRLAAGDVVMEVTSPRIPCNTFAARMQDKLWVKRFFAANRPGIYVRVLQTGTLQAGMDVIRTPFAGEPVPAIELMSDYKNPDPERMRRLMQAPIHRDLAAKYRQKLG